jgi:prophage tail gpP-like protein
MTLILRTPKIGYNDTASIVKTLDTNYKTFKSFIISRSIDDVCGKFKIVISRPQTIISPLRTGDTVDIILDGTQVMRGKIYENILTGDAFSDDIIISGRDITGDIVDSTVPDDSKVYSNGVSIFDIAGKILGSMQLSDDIGIRNQTGGTIIPFTDDEIVSCNVGYTVIKFLMKYCRKRQLFLNTDAFGRLVFFKADGVTTGNRIINLNVGIDNNVISYKVKYNISNRFGRYVCKTQDIGGWGDLTVDAVGGASDPQITARRTLEFKMEEGGDSSEGADRAAEESNVRRARGFEYVVTVQGFKDKQFWGVNQFVTVADDKADVHGTFLVKAVEYRLDNILGRTTKLTITNKDAYTAQAAISLREAQESDAGSGWNNTVSDALLLETQQ